MVSAFISHSHKDKLFAKYLASWLSRYGVKVWIDDAEINIGESLISKIGKNIGLSDYVLAILSKHSIKSKWVMKELSIAMSKEIEGKRVVVLPIKIDNCRIPPFLSDKLYCKFSSDIKTWHQQINILMRNLGINQTLEESNENQTLPLNMTIPAAMKHIKVTRKDCDTIGSAVLDYSWHDDIFMPIIVRANGRVLAEDINFRSYNVSKGQVFVDPLKENRNIYHPIRIRSVLHCGGGIMDTITGMCSLCYGIDPSTNRIVDVGKNIGISASKRIIKALSEINDISSVSKILDFQAMDNYAYVSPSDGIVRFQATSNGETIIKIDTKESNNSCTLHVNGELLINEGDYVWMGRKLTRGDMYPVNIMNIWGENVLRDYLLSKLKLIFLKEGINILERDLEILVMSMTNNVKVCEDYDYEADFEFLKGEIIPRSTFRAVNDQYLSPNGLKHLVGESSILGLSEIYYMDKYIRRLSSKIMKYCNLV